MSKQKNKQRGITLIALIVTIIVLIILAGVSISMVVGDNGIITQAQKAKQETEIKSDEEKIRLAINVVQIKNNGNSKIKKDDLEIALSENGTKAIVVDNEDGTRNIIFLDSKKIYKLNSDGSIEDTNSNFDGIYVAPETQDEVRNEGIIGIGTDGNPVDMDLWEWMLLEDGTYCLNSINNLDETWVTGYKGEVVEGKIEGSIPTYISNDEGKNWKEVSELFMTFYNLENLTNMPKLPNTLKKGKYTFFNCKQLKNIENLPANIKSLEGFFYGCESLSKFPTIPNGVEDLTSTFFNCKSLISSPIIPESVKIMHATFAGCSKLTVAPNIPQHVENMAYTFSYCTALETAPKVIPESVTNLNRTFQYCSNLNGIININANVKGNIIQTERDYENIFYNAVTNEGCKVQLTGTCSILQNIINASNNPNISLLV